LQLIGWNFFLFLTQLFTNSDRAHMKRALERLGVDESVFDAVVCFETMNPHLFGEERHRAATAGGDPPAVVLKPAVDAIVAGLRAAGTNPRRTVTTPILTVVREEILQGSFHMRFTTILATLGWHRLM